MKLFFASVFTLTLLSGLLGSLILAYIYLTGAIEIYLLFGLIIFINFVLWLIGPAVSDMIYWFFYKIRWVSIEELKKESPSSANFMVKTCEKYGFKIPKIGIIPDKNPNAFTYGSGRWNGRIVITEGIFEYLDENERTAVYAHELGHIKNRDFIVMTVASTILQLIYEVYVVCKNAVRSSRGGGKKGKGKGPLLLLMVVSYIFYWIGQYVILYLSRVREYYADQFSAKETNPNHLSSALIKICYGILINPDDVRLVNSTKYIGIADFKVAENIGLVYYNCKNLKNFEPMNKAFVYDLKNPWAFVTELNSTHPLTGKRLRQLSVLSSKPLFNFEEIERKYPVDKARLYSGFFRDLSILFIPWMISFGFPVLYLIAVFQNYLNFTMKVFFGGWLILFGMGIILISLYKYPNKVEKETTVIELMSDIYASPVRGKSVQLKGQLIGRGVPGLIFSEDMVMKDKTGLMFLNYESWLPIFGNLFFGLNKVPKLLNKDAEITGWFVRGMSPIIGLKALSTKEDHVKGFLKLGSLIGGFILIIAGGIVFLVL